MDDLGNPPAVTVRQMIPEDIPAVIRLQSQVYPDMLIWSPDELTHHMTVFPEGQLVAVDDTGRVLGSASSLLIDWDDYAESAKWSTITGRGTFA